MNRHGGIEGVRCLHRWSPLRQSAAERLRGMMNMNTEHENTMTAGPSPPPKTNTLERTNPPSGLWTLPTPWYHDPAKVALNDTIEQAVFAAQDERRGKKCGCEQAEKALRRQIRAALPPAKAKVTIRHLEENHLGPCCPSCCPCFWDRMVEGVGDMMDEEVVA